MRRSHYQLCRQLLVTVPCLLLFLPPSGQAAIQASFESPLNGQAVAAIFIIRGWSFDTQSGNQITGVKLFIDDVVAGDVPCCSGRADVQGAFPQFPTQNTLNSGWGITFNWGVLNAGTHTIRIEINSSSGEVFTTETRTVTVVRLGDFEFLDQFDLSQASVQVEGNDLVVKNLTVQDQATKRQKRVEARFRWFESSQSFGLIEAVTVLEFSSLSSTLSSLMGSLLGGFQNLFDPPTVQAGTGIIAAFESPQISQAVSGVGVIRIWAFAETVGVKVSSVRLMIDNQLIGNTPCCSGRGDVAAAYPGNPNALNSGAGITFNYGVVKSGIHFIEIEIETSDGAFGSFNHWVTVIKPGDYEFLDKFDISKATAGIEEGKILLEGVIVRDKAGQQTKTVDIRLGWIHDAQALGITGSVEVGGNHSGPTYVFGDEVQAVKQQAITEATELAMDYAQIETGERVENFTIHVFGDYTKVVDAYMKWYNLPESQRTTLLERWQKISGAANLGVIFWNLGSPIYDDPVVLLQSNGHEYFHIVQLELSQWGGSPSNQVPPVGPIWLLEGSAILFHTKFAAHEGKFMYANARSFKVSTSKQTSALLSSMETRDGFSAVNVGDLAFLAAELLSNTSGSLASFFAFYAGVGLGMTWQESFQTVFGRSIGDFYAEFEAYRQQGFPPL